MQLETVILIQIKASVRKTNIIYLYRSEMVTLGCDCYFYPMLMAFFFFIGVIH